MNGALVARSDFYVVACDPARSVVVEACAGAGKTWMLVSRIVRALLEGVEPQQIVAITFTRKAAGEMRERLQQWLAEFAQADPAQRVLALQQRGLSAEQAQARAQDLAGLQQRLLEAGRSVDIRTFHAWFSQLLRAAPLALLQSLGLSPELQLLEDEAELMPELWRQFHSAVLADPQLREDYQALIDQRGRSSTTKWLEAGFAKRVELRLAHEHGTLMGSVSGAASVSAKFAQHSPLQYFATLTPELLGLAAALGAGSTATQREKGSEIERACSDEPDLALRLAAVSAALLTKDGKLRAALKKFEAAEPLAEELTLVQQAIEQEQAQQNHQRLCRLSLALLEAFDALKRRQGLVDMNDLERGAMAVLSDAQLSGWVQQRLDAQVRHVLIDEFQDTSPLQWQALYAWLSGYAGAGGGGSGQRPPAVFIVGDPKQSIYRFRRAEPRVFAAARDFVQEALGGAVLACDHTRRNAPPVLDAVNAALLAAQSAGQYSGFRAHTTEHDGAVDPLQGFVSLDVPSEETATAEGEEQPEAEAPAQAQEAWRASLEQPRHEAEVQRRWAEAERIAQALADLLRHHGVAPGEVFVLARKREGLRVLSQSLKRWGIAHVAPEEHSLLDAPDVLDMLALLDALASPQHDLSLAQALRSPVFGVSDAVLLQLSRRAGLVERLAEEGAAPLRSSLWLALMDEEHAASLDEATQRARSLLQRWSQRRAHSTPHELLDAIVHEGDVPARVAACVPPAQRSARLHALRSLLGLALDLDGGRYATLHGFVRALRQRALTLPAHSQADAVQLLTVHGAKGLEARVVVLMDCDAPPAKADYATLLVDWPVLQSWPQRVAFIASESRPPQELAALMEAEQAERMREELNALYVAMTRAKSRLVLSRTVGARKSPEGTWWRRLQGLAQVLALPPLAPPAPGGSEGQVALAELAELPTLQGDALPPEAAAEAAPATASLGEPEELVVRSSELDELAALGEALHRVLEWVSRPGARAADAPRYTGAAAQMYGLDARRRERLEQAVAAILGSPDCAPFFANERLRWAGNEVPLTLDGVELRLDRLVCVDGVDGRPHWWVIDYKLHPRPQQDEGYVQQLARYVRAVRALQPGEAVGAGFITGQGQWIDVSEKLSQYL
ncbi:UvrD-helicase domain-containing protein [Roseateles sp. BYS180W]|uniref:DNA 3'-5' helicase n=1 Tax=Roseateles rivi TaxID=3299028 RepID=A0ABW7FZ57_9BURK